MPQGGVGSSTFQHSTECGHRLRRFFKRGKGGRRSDPQDLRAKDLQPQKGELSPLGQGGAKAGGKQVLPRGQPPILSTVQEVGLTRRSAAARLERLPPPPCSCCNEPNTTRGGSGVTEAQASGTTVCTRYQTPAQGRDGHTDAVVLPPGFDPARAPLPTNKNLLAPAGAGEWGRVSTASQLLWVSSEAGQGYKTARSPKRPTPGPGGNSQNPFSLYTQPP